MRGTIPWAVLFLLLAVLVLHLPVLFGGRVRLALDQRMFPPWSHCLDGEEGAPLPGTRPYNRLSTDSNFWYLGQLRMATAQVRSGLYPAWDPHTMCGTPLAAQSGAPPIYPPYWLLLLGDPVVMMGWLAALHMFLAALLARGFLRHLGAGPEAALLAGLAWGIGPWMVLRANNMTLLASSTWLPLALWGASLVGGGVSRRKGAFLFALAGALALSGGMPQLGFVTLGGGLALGSVRLWARRAGWREGLLLLAGTAVAGLLAAPALVPAARLYLESVRGVHPELAGSLGLAPGALAGILSPELFGCAATGHDGWDRIQEFPLVRAFLTGHPQDNPLENCLYPGASLLLLGLLGLRGPRRPGGKVSAFFLLLALTALILALRLLPLPALYRLPGVGPEDPRRLLLLFHMGWTVAGAFALDRLWKETGAGPVLGATGAMLCALPLALLVAMGWVLPGLGRSLLALLPAPLAAQEVDRLLQWERFALLGPAVAAALTALALALPRRWRPAAAALILLTVAGEMLLFSYRSNPAPPARSLTCGDRSGVLAALREMQDRAGPEGAPRLIHLDHFHALQGNLVAWRGTGVISATHPLPLDRVVTRFTLVDPTLFDPDLPRGLGLLGGPALVDHPLLTRARVGLFCCTRPATARALAAKGLRRIHPPPGREGENEGVALYSLPPGAAPPRARLLFAWRQVPDRTLAFAHLADHPTGLIPVESKAPLPSPRPPSDPSHVTWIEAGPGRIELEVDTGGGTGLLFLADSWYPGWEARLDEEPVPILPADGAFMAIPVAGRVGEKRRLVLRFHDPDRWRLVLLFLLGCAGAVLLGRRRRRPIRSGPATWDDQEGIP